MDPDAALKEIRLLYGYISRVGNKDPKAERLAELIMGLDEWLSRGGFLPDDWQRNRKDDS